MITKCTAHADLYQFNDHQGGENVREDSVDAGGDVPDHEYTIKAF